MAKITLRKYPDVSNEQTGDTYSIYDNDIELTSVGYSNMYVLHLDNAPKGLLTAFMPSNPSADVRRVVNFKELTISEIDFLRTAPANEVVSLLNAKKTERDIND